MLEVFPRSIEGYGWASSNSNDESNDEIKKQLIKYKNYIDELQYKIKVLKIENLKLKEEIENLTDR